MTGTIIAVTTMADVFQTSIWGHMSPQSGRSASGLSVSWIETLHKGETPARGLQGCPAHLGLPWVERPGVWAQPSAQLASVRVLAINYDLN
jgi:hypothetical protein